MRVPGSNSFLANERKESWASRQRPGPRLFIAGFNIDGDRLRYAVSVGITSERHLDIALLRSKELEMGFIKVYVQLPFEFKRRVVQFAHEHSIPVASNSSLAASTYGVDHIEHFAGITSRSYSEKPAPLT